MWGELAIVDARTIVEGNGEEGERKLLLEQWKLGGENDRPKKSGLRLMGHDWGIKWVFIVNGFGFKIWAQTH